VDVMKQIRSPPETGVRSEKGGTLGDEEEYDFGCCGGLSKSRGSSGS